MCHAPNERYFQLVFQIMSMFSLVSHFSSLVSQLVSQLVGALSLVNHRGLHQGYTFHIILFKQYPVLVLHIKGMYPFVCYDILIKQYPVLVLHMKGMYPFVCYGILIKQQPVLVLHSEGVYPFVRYGIFIKKYPVLVLHSKGVYPFTLLSAIYNFKRLYHMIRNITSNRQSCFKNVAFGLLYTADICNVIYMYIYIPYISINYLNVINAPFSFKIF